MLLQVHVLARVAIGAIIGTLFHLLGPTTDPLIPWSVGALGVYFSFIIIPFPWEAAVLIEPLESRLTNFTEVRLPCAVGISTIPACMLEAHADRVFYARLVAMETQRHIEQLHNAFVWFAVPTLLGTLVSIFISSLTPPGGEALLRGLTFFSAWVFPLYMLGGTISKVDVLRTLVKTCIIELEARFLHHARVSGSMTSRSSFSAT